MKKTIANSWAIVGIKILSVVGLVMSAVSVTQAAYEISDGSVKGLFHLEDVTDASGNGNTLTNNGLVTFSAGKLNNAAVFDGVASYLSRGNAISNKTNDYSVSFWVYGDGGSQRGWVSNGSDQGGNSKGWAVANGNGSYTHPNGLSIGVGWCYFSDVTLNAADWNYIVYNVSADDQQSLTLNNVSSTVTCHQTNGTPYSAFFEIGSVHVNTNYFWNDKIDELAVIDRTLTPTEMTALWNGGSGEEICTTGGCAPTSTPPASSGDWSETCQTTTANGSTTVNCYKPLQVLFFYFVDGIMFLMFCTVVIIGLNKWFKVKT